MNPPRRPASGPVVPRPPSRSHRLVAALAHLAARGLDVTLRMRVIDHHRAIPLAIESPAIYAIWHNRLALSMALFRRFIKQRDPGRRLAALVSASRDGAMLSAILESHGVWPVRGSTSRRGPQALLELASRAAEGFDLAITPDGPRGPCYQVQTGILGLARVTGLRIIPVTWNARWKLRLRSWDRFQIPLPFASCEVVFGSPLRIPRDASDADLDAARATLQATLMATTCDE